LSGAEQNPPFGRIFLTEASKKLKIKRFVESSLEASKKLKIKRFVESSLEASKKLKIRKCERSEYFQYIKLYSIYYEK
jgi:hypothetical protein